MFHGTRLVGIDNVSKMASDWRLWRGQEPLQEVQREGECRKGRAEGFGGEPTVWHFSGTSCIGIPDPSASRAL